MEVYLSTETISEAVWRASRTECWESLASGKYVSMMIKAERNRPEYIFDATISNLDQRIWLIHRLGSLDWKKRYRNRHNNTECPFFNCSQDDTFDHSLVCLENPVKKPRKVEDRQEVTEYLKALHRVRLELTGVGLINL